MSFVDGANYGFGQNNFGLPTNNMQNVPPPLPPSGLVGNNGSYFNNTSGSVDTGGAGSNNSSTPPFYPSDGPAASNGGVGGGYGWQYGSYDPNWSVSDGPAASNGGAGGGYGAQYAGTSSGSPAALPSGGVGNGANVSMGFADGGVVPDQGQPPDLGSAAALAKQVLAMGRQRNGLPPTLMGDQNSYNGSADGLQTPDDNGDSDGDVDPTAFLSRGYADGGDVTEGGDMSDPSAGGMPEAPDAQPSQDPGQAGQAGMSGPVAAKMVGYLGGAEAVTPEIAQAMQQRVDPTGRMDPNSKTLLSIASAPQGAQWGMMQHYRQKYDATKAFALAAAQGTQGKPPDINASTQAATQAHQNLPDGNSVVFSPHPQGVAVHVQPLTSSKTKGYDDGGEVTDDQEDTPLPTPDPRGTAGRADDSVGEPDADALSGAASAIKSFVMSVPQYLSFLKGREGQYDNVMDKGINQAIQAQISSPDDASAAGPPPVSGAAQDQFGAQSGAPDEPSMPSPSTSSAAQTSSAPANRLNRGVQTQQVPAGFRPGTGQPYNRTVRVPSTATAAPGPSNTPPGLNRAGKKTSAPAAAPGASQQDTGGDLNSFVDNFNKQNKTNYSVGSGTPDASFAQTSRQPAKYAGTTPQDQLMGARTSGAPSQPQGERPFIDPDAIPADIQRQANAIYPSVDQQAERQAFIVKQLESRETNANKVEVAQNTHLYGNQATAAAHQAGAQSAADARVQSSQINSGARVDTARIKAQSDVMMTQAKNPMEQAAYRSLSAYLTANPGATQAQIAETMRTLRINPQAVGMQSQAPAAAQQPQAPKQKPLAVTQNGHTYNLQPDGSYK